jgi:hypothetical protein
MLESYFIKRGQIVVFLFPLKPKMKHFVPKTLPRRVKLMERDIKEAYETYDEIIVEGPSLESSPEGQEILDHATTNRSAMFR